MKPFYEKIPQRPASSFGLLDECAARIDSPLHVHPECELALVLEGFGSRIVNDDVASYEPGTLILTGPETPHQYRGAAESPAGRIRVLQFRMDFAGRDFFMLPELTAERSLLESSVRGITFDTETARRAGEILAEMESGSGGLRVELLLKLLRFLAEAPRRFLAADRVGGAAGGEARINRALHFIHARFDAHATVTLGEASGHIGMGQEVFSRFFRRTTGMRFIDYVLELKIERAAHLLLHTDRTVSDVAEASGFGNGANFNRQFLRRRGRTPSEFRAQKRP